MRPLFVAPVCFLIVSIHAPTRGATRIHTDLTMDIKVSIHAPTRGATRTEQIISVQAVVSIHAPTRGATVVVVASHILSSFNPRTHTGCDQWLRDNEYLCSVGFNPRTHTGCDGWKVGAIVACRCFNPRTHTGCDLLLCFIVKHITSFNPRTHTGCDLILTLLPLLVLFQSTHPHGVRLHIQQTSEYQYAKLRKMRKTTKRMI